ncbi:hypothetical protein BpHYR1_029088 [Brachionus plicatilis]|uniref:Uncharacterized protein n=1 Tax=Brachionus plicatilis TaxID=10195 RepID=A0A3M7Q417_BRAPC|nr:hypothetical protein BpHYR1_029088 [Brachionus plicatilis]
MKFSQIGIYFVKWGKTSLAGHSTNFLKEDSLYLMIKKKNQNKTYFGKDCNMWHMFTLIHYFDRKKYIVLFKNYKIHGVSTNFYGLMRIRCQSCKSISITVNQATICLQKYEELKNEARTNPDFSFAKSYSQLIQSLQSQYDPKLELSSFQEKRLRVSFAQKQKQKCTNQTIHRIK